jgi:PAS domain S-box-containing protein
MVLVAGVSKSTLHLKWKLTVAIMFKYKRALRYTLALALIGLLLTLLIAYVERSTISTYQKNLPFITLGDNVKNLTSTAYLRLEELMDGNPDFDFESDVMTPLNQSKDILDGAYEGKETVLGRFELVEDETSRLAIKNGLDDVNLLIDAAKLRWKSKGNAAVSDSVDIFETDPTQQALDDAYREAQASMDKLVNHINEKVSGDTGYLTKLSWISVGFVAIVFGVLCLQLFLIERRSEQTASDSQAKLEKETKRVASMSSFIEAVSAGDYNVELDESSQAEDDDLTKLLVTMRNKLRQNAEDDKKRNWSTSGLAQIGEILRANTSLTELYDNIIRFVVKYTNSNQGGLFILNDDDDRDQFLELVACYAFERKKFLVKRFNIDQGLVGQCYLERERIYMKSVPQDYVNITSGLGGVNANTLLLVPVKVNDKIYGVLELASLKPLEDYQIDLVEKFAESMASTISTVKTNESTKILLEKSQQQAEEMKAQEEEMRQNMEELSATQEEMSRKNAEVEKMLNESGKKETELKAKLEEVANMKKVEEVRAQERIAYIDNYKKTLLGVLDHLPHKIFLKDQDGKMVLVNTAVAKAHHMSVDELIGKSDFDFVDAATAQDWRNQELEIVRKGSETYIHSDSIGGETRKLKTVKSAFFIPHLNQTGLLGVQTDITEQGN